MIYKNPVLSGFYPDPSVCFDGNKFYMVCSSFQYFPGVPLFESDNLVNWKQIGYVLTRSTQVYLDDVRSSGGVFAPTIRYNDGRFYMVTTNDSTHENFYVYTDDIYGEWSDPIPVNQDGIDPSLLFDNDHVYFLSNGTDDFGNHGVVQCEIDIKTGKKISHSKAIWQGSGGRYLESPHMYHIGNKYYLMAAEGGTEYGHMITYAISDDVWGEFKGYKHNPVLTNRNKAPYLIQGIGHGDLISDKNGQYFILSLGFRQIGIWETYHTLGREVFLTPVQFDDEGFFTAGKDGTTDEEYEIKGDFTQDKLPCFTFENTDPNIDWCYLRKPKAENYSLSKEKYILKGSKVTLDEALSPTFIALRQREFDFTLETDLSLEGSGYAGVTVYMDENIHYDLYADSKKAYLKLNIGEAKSITKEIPIEGDIHLEIKADSHGYNFGVNGNYMGRASSKYLSTEVAGGFTGVMLGLFAVNDCKAEFSKLEIRY